MPRTAWFRLVCVCCLLLGATATPAAVAAQSTDTPDVPHPTIVAAYPDPIADGDTGEFVVLEIPNGTDVARYSFTDGDATVSLANVSERGRVALSPDPARARNRTNATVVGVDRLALANGGERLRVRRNGTVVDRAVYRDTEEGHLLIWNGTAPRWRPIGATDRPVVTATDGHVHAFVLPDGAGVPIETLRDADERLLLAGYTLTSERVTAALVAAHDRGVTVRVLLEGQPVGERTSQGARRLDRLIAAGVEVQLIGGDHARYAYHHAKYAVVDDRALVLTENWKPSGTGGHDSRGWGVRTNQSAVVEGLAATFRADAGGRDAIPWSRFRRGRAFERGEPSNVTYEARFAPETVPVDRTTLLVTPDNAESRTVETLDRANDTVDVLQMSIGWESDLAAALRRAADRGVRVRILLSSAWYVREENRAMADRFAEWASANDASLTVRLADPAGRYGKIHAKGAVVDDRRVVLGSLNWNDQAAERNREVLLLLHGRAVADYYGAVFDADWRGGRSRLPFGLLGAVAGCLGLAAIVAGKLRFEKR